MDDLLVFAYKGQGRNDTDDLDRAFGLHSPRQKRIQIYISVTFGLVTFLTFCVLRPRWTGLYAARKPRKNEASVLPELPASFLGWILPLWKITDQQVLASAGLDAYAFLAFFKLAIKFLLVTLFFSLVVIMPVHDANPEDQKHEPGRNDTTISFSNEQRTASRLYDGFVPYETDYLWMYVVFAYLFSAFAIYLVVAETRKIIEVRQEYLGTQTSVTDRTIRLSGIPAELQDEGKIKGFIESLEIGEVESVTLCRNWKELDGAVITRMDTLRRLEEAYTIHTGYRSVERNLESLPISQPAPPDPPAHLLDQEDDEEGARLVESNVRSNAVPYNRSRPQIRIRYGFMKYHSKQVDAIDYYEEKLRQEDEQVQQLRQKIFAPTPLAFVTMDSVAASQMAIQAVLDPSPLQLIANPSPSPSDVIWSNTYMPRRNRMLRSWSITALIILMTIFWSGIFVAIAGLLNAKAIGRVFPQLGNFLKEHKNISDLVEAQVPTLLASLLMAGVPYLYYWLSWYQGMISQGDVELSAISKNFFFTFFNFFVIFTISGTISNFATFFDRFQDVLKDPQKVAYSLAIALQEVRDFYVNFIILQGVGLFPFRLLEFGSVSLYPVFRMGAKTPRDYAELVQPPVFSYGFYLPNALLIFIICQVYSVLRQSWQVLLAGLIYFFLGHFVYKYQLLYAMDHRQQATGRGWAMICDRIFVGLVFFQLTTFGQLVLQKAVARSVLMVPLIAFTIWFNIAYGRTYKPLMKFIALRSIKKGEQYTDHEPSPDANSTISTDLAPERNAWAENDGPQLRYFRETRTPLGRAVDESAESGLRFINPSLVAPLGGVWIADKNVNGENSNVLPDGNETF